jgi:hypothetical protein
MNTNKNLEYKPVALVAGGIVDLIPDTDTQRAARAAAVVAEAVAIVLEAEAAVAAETVVLIATAVPKAAAEAARAAQKASGARDFAADQTSAKS